MEHQELTALLVEIRDLQKAYLAAYRKDTDEMLEISRRAAASNVESLELSRATARQYEEYLTTARAMGVRQKKLERWALVGGLALIVVCFALCFKAIR